MEFPGRRGCVVIYQSQQGEVLVDAIADGNCGVIRFRRQVHRAGDGWSGAAAGKDFYVIGAGREGDVGG